MRRIHSSFVSFLIAFAISWVASADYTIKFDPTAGADSSKYCQEKDGKMNIKDLFQDGLKVFNESQVKMILGSLGLTLKKGSGVTIGNAEPFKTGLTILSELIPGSKTFVVYIKDPQATAASGNYFEFYHAVVDLVNNKVVPLQLEKGETMFYQGNGTLALRCLHYDAKTQQLGAFQYAKWKKYNTVVGGGMNYRLFDVSTGDLLFKTDFASDPDPKDYPGWYADKIANNKTVDVIDQAYIHPTHPKPSQIGQTSKCSWAYGWQTGGLYDEAEATSLEVVSKAKDLSFLVTRFHEVVAPDCNFNFAKYSSEQEVDYTFDSKKNNYVESSRSDIEQLADSEWVHDFVVIEDK